MSRISLSGINFFAKKTAERLFEKFPDWEMYAGIDPVDEEALRVEVPVPKASGRAGLSRTRRDCLWISTAGWSVHVGFDIAHTRFWNDDCEDCIRYPVEMITDIIEERIFVCLELENGKWAWTWRTGLNECTLWRTPVRGLIAHRSWRGTHNELTLVAGSQTDQQLTAGRMLSERRQSEKIEDLSEWRLEHYF